METESTLHSISYSNKFNEELEIKETTEEGIISLEEDSELDVEELDEANLTEVSEDELEDSMEDDFYENIMDDEDITDEDIMKDLDDM